jgi:hypothetical protein
MTRDEQDALARRTCDAVRQVMGRILLDVDSDTLRPDSEETRAVIEGALRAVLILIAMMPDDAGRTVLAAMIEWAPTALRRGRLAYRHVIDQKETDEP